MTLDEEERRDLLFDIAKVINSNFTYYSDDSASAVKELLCNLAAGDPIKLTMNYRVMQFLKKKHQPLWHRLFKYVAEGYVKP